MPFDLPATEPIAKAIIEATGRFPAEAFDTDFRTVDVAILGDWYLRGMDNVFCDWAEENPVSDWLLDYFTERSVNKCRAFARAGCDVIRPGDDVGTQGSLLISKEMWRRNLKPRLKRVIDAIRGVSDGRKIWGHYHSDGEMTALVEDLFDVGIDILNPVQPECMDIEKVASEFQSRITFSRNDRHADHHAIWVSGRRAGSGRQMPETARGRLASDCRLDACPRTGCHHG